MQPHCLSEYYTSACRMEQVTVLFITEKHVFRPRGNSVSIYKSLPANNFQQDHIIPSIPTFGFDCF